MNLTKVKIDMKSLMEKKKKEEQSKNLDEVKKEMLIQTTDQWLKN